MSGRDRQLRAPLAMLFALVATTCMCPEAATLEAIQQATEDAEAGQTASAQRTQLSQTQAAVAGTQTARARATATTPPTATQLPAEAHVPRIETIDIAREIPRDGTRVKGSLIFTDAAHDVLLVKAQVISAGLSADSFSFDPRPDTVWQGDHGATTFVVWCTGDPQTVRYAFTVQDAAGNISDPYQLEYHCK
jgi:hypothetical protein